MENVMLCKPLDIEKIHKWGTRILLTQPKLDGIRCKAVKVNSEWYLLTRNGNVILSTPHITNSLKILDEDLNFENLTFDGELYSHGMDFNSIQSIVMRDTPSSDRSLISYHIFDIIDEHSPTVSRISKLFSLGIISSIIKVVSTNEININDIDMAFEDYLSHGYEGIIVRHPLANYEFKRSNYILKFKPKKMDMYKIIGFIEEVDTAGNPKNSLGSLIVSNDPLSSFKVGTGFTKEQRETMWKHKESLIGKSVIIRFQSISDKGIPRFPVYLEVI